MTLFSDYQNYFDTTSAGDSQAFNGGTLTRGPRNQATFTDSLGQGSTFHSTPEDALNLYNTNPTFTNAWDKTYRGDTPGTIGLDPLPTPGPPIDYNVPTDLFPSTNQSSQSSGSSNSRSGINFQSPVTAAIMPDLIRSGQNLQGNVDAMGGRLQDLYANQMRRAFDPNNFQGLLNRLSNRGVMDSSIAENTLAQAGSMASKAIADKAFESNLAQSQAQLQVPNILAGIAGLGQESVSEGTQAASSQSSTQDPLAPYQLMADYMFFKP